MQSLKQHIRRCIGPPLQALGYHSGLMQISARLQGVQGAIALMYHSVAEHTTTPWVDPRNHVPAEVFAEQMAFLAKRRKVIALTELIAMLKQGETPANGTVVITFDDGYLDNLTIAAPIIDHLGLTATLFLPTSYIDRGENQWVDQAYSAFKFRTRDLLTWGVEPATSYDLKDPEQYQAGYRAICNSMLSILPEQRRTWLADLQDQLRPSSRPPRLTMTWNDVHSLITNYRCFEIGGHTLEHTDLTCVSDDDAKNELTGCAQRINETLGLNPQYFSFSYGRTSTKLRQFAADTGFKAAFGGGGSGPIITKTTNLYALPRIEAPASTRRFDLATSTANSGIWRKLGR